MKHIILTALALCAALSVNAQFVVEMKNGTTTPVNGNITFTANASGDSFAIGETYTEAGDLSQIESITLAPAANAAVGDYYYSDGTFSPTLDDTKQVIGIVFWTGNPTAQDEALLADHPQCSHGLVVGLNERQTEWQDYYEDCEDLVSAWITGNTGYAPIYSSYGVDAAYNRTAGYNNSKGIEAFNDEFQWDYEVIAVSGIDFIMDQYTLPANVSGWYLPSAKEMSLIISGDYDGDIDDLGYLDTPPVENLALINSRLATISGAKQISGVYWTSNEASTRQAFSIKTANALLMETSKGGSNAIRPIFAF